MFLLNKKIEWILIMKMIINFDINRNYYYLEIKQKIKTDISYTKDD